MHALSGTSQHLNWGGHCCTHTYMHVHVCMYMLYDACHTVKPLNCDVVGIVVVACKWIMVDIMHVCVHVTVELTECSMSSLHCNSEEVHEDLKDST